MKSQVHPSRDLRMIAPQDLSRCCAHHDLGPVRGVHHACGPIHRRTEVVASAFVSLAGVDAHANPQRQVLRPRSPGEDDLGLDGGLDGMLRPLEGDTEPVPTRREDVTTASGDRRPQQLVMQGKSRPHRVGVPLPSRGRALDIREQKRHRPRRGLSHRAQYFAMCRWLLRAGGVPTRRSTSTSGSRVNELGQHYAVVGGDHLRGFLADHDASRVGVAAHHVGHDARVGDTEPGDTRDP